MSTNMEENQFHMFVLRKKLDVNGEDVSDIIICRLLFDTQFFYNASSHKISPFLKNVVRGRRYIVLNETRHIGAISPKPKGFYLKYDEEEETLYFVGVRLQKTGFCYRWVETARGAVNKYGLRDVGKAEDIFSCYSFDICGQSIISNTDNNLLYLKDYVGYSCYGGRGIYNIGAEKTMASYLGTLPVHHPYATHFRRVDNFLSFLDGDFDRIEKHGIVPIDCLDIDDKAKERIYNYAMVHAESRVLYWKIKTPLACNVQYIRVNNGKIEREIFDILYLFDEASIDSFKLMAVSCGVMESRKITDVNPFIAGRERFPDSMEYAAFFIDNWLSLYDKYCMDEDGANKAKDIYLDRYGIYFYAAPYFSELFAAMPVIEKVYNMGYEQFNKWMLKKIWFAGGSTTEAVIDIFGRVGDRKTLNQSLMLPKGFFEYLVEKNCYDSIRRYKSIFSTNEGPMDYFLRMNRDCFKDLADGFLYHENLFETMRGLVSVYGPGNWRDYIKNLEEVVKNGMKAPYREYVNMLSLAKEQAHCFPWKVNTEEEIKNSTDKFYPVFYDRKYGKENNKYFSVFSSMGKEWQKYEYSDGNYMVSYPKKPSELAMEGAALRHCAGQFINSVAKGDTIILFIRRCCNPDTPFYTLEVKEGKIRQCHGFANKTIADDFELVEFLRKFCEKKGIEFSYGTSQFGIG